MRSYDTLKKKINQSYKIVVVYVYKAKTNKKKNNQKTNRKRTRVLFFQMQCKSNGRTRTKRKTVSPSFFAFCSSKETANANGFWKTRAIRNLPLVFSFDICITCVSICFWLLRAKIAQSQLNGVIPYYVQDGTGQMGYASKKPLVWTSQNGAFGGANTCEFVFFFERKRLKTRLCDL